jgi:hypothetical protein
MKLSRVGVDLAKNVYQLHGVDRHGKTVWKPAPVHIIGRGSFRLEATR